TYAKYAAFFDIAQALILNFLQGRPMATFYETITNGRLEQIILTPANGKASVEFTPFKIRLPGIRD
ncbi:MAG: hypothetical protein C4548_10155, partial [Desulfobacteraceae bacterium]